MKELQDILSAYESLKQAGSSGALATVMKVQGSTYRRPGARMLILGDGKTVGTVSGGCLEADIAEKSKTVVSSGRPATFVYDMTVDGDAVWGLNQGCNGVVHLLVEPIPPRDGFGHLEFLRDCLHQRISGAVATVFRVDGEFKASVGMRVLLDERGVVRENTKNPVLTAALLEECQRAINSSRGTVREFRFTEGVVEAFIELVQPAIPLFIFGGGYDAIPLARFAKELGWEVTVVDHRPAFASRERFPGADSFILARPEEVGAKVALDKRSVAVIMTHNYTHDLELLKALLPSQASYVGLLGPKMRTERLLRNLAQVGITPTESQLHRLHTPIGIDIGAESPEEIALSILAEIRAVLSKRSGGFLKDSSSPIHESHS
jgi:xanthine/CO dehydrogenase XdhC/CoxF family maturation factor